MCDFRQSTLDFSGYNEGDIIAACLDQSPGLGRFMSSTQRQTPRTPQYAQVRQLITSYADASAAYEYITLKAKRRTQMMTHELITHAFVTGGSVQPVEKAFFPMVVTPEQGIDKLVSDLNVMKCPEFEEAYATQGLNMNAKNMPDFEGVAIQLENEVYVAPTIRGEPLFEAVGQDFLKRHGIDAQTIRSVEVSTAHAIVDLARLDKGVLVPKLPPEGLGLFSVDDRKKMEKFALDINSIFGAALANEPTQKGRPLIKTLLRVMTQSRTVPGYEDFVMRTHKWTGEKRNVQIPAKLGEFTPVDLEYARELLGRMRGVRGGDDKESTSLGVSAYLPFSVDRPIVKMLQRATDLINLRKLLGFDEVTIVGKEARKWVEALLAVDTSLKSISCTNPNLVGWVNQGGVWTNPKYQTVLMSGRAGQVINVDKLDMRNQLSKDYDSQGQVLFVDAPKDFLEGRFIPSCIAHNLSGFLLPTWNPKIAKGLTSGLKGYLTTVNMLNVVRTYPAFFPNDRACKLMKKRKMVCISTAFCTRLMKVAQKTSFVDLMTSDGMNCDDLAAHFNDTQIAVIVAATKPPDPVVPIVSLGFKDDDLAGGDDAAYDPDAYAKYV